MHFYACRIFFTCNILQDSSNKNKAEHAFQSYAVGVVALGAMGYIYNMLILWQSYIALPILEQGRSHAFKTGGAQAAKTILGPFYLEKWGAQPYFYYGLSQKVGVPGPSRPIVRLRLCFVPQKNINT